MADLLERLKDAEANKRPHPFRRIDADMVVSPIYAVSAYELADLMQEISKRDARISALEADLREYKFLAEELQTGHQSDKAAFSEQRATLEVKDRQINELEWELRQIQRSRQADIDLACAHYQKMYDALLKSVSDSLAMTNPVRFEVMKDD